MPNPNRPENANSIAPGATVAMLTAARIQHQGVTNRYIDTNTGRRAAFNQSTRAGLGLRIRLVAMAAMPMAAQIHNAEWICTQNSAVDIAASIQRGCISCAGEFTTKTIRPEDLPPRANRRP